MRAVATVDGGAIGPVCRNLVVGDIRRKIHAFTQATGALEGTPGTTSFIRTLRADPATITDALPALLPEPWLMLDEFRTAWGPATVPVASTRVVGTGTPGDPPSR